MNEEEEKPDSHWAIRLATYYWSIARNNVDYVNPLVIFGLTSVKLEKPHNWKAEGF